MVRWVTLIVYAALIFAVSSRPLPLDYVPRIPHFDKLMHLAAYGVMAMLCFRVFWQDREHPAPGWVLILAAVLTTVYGAVAEFHQIYVPRREFDWLDIAANGVGAALAVALWEPLTRRYAWLK